MTEWEVTFDIGDQGYSYTVIEKTDAPNAICAVEDMVEEYGDKMKTVDEVYDVG